MYVCGTCSKVRGAPPVHFSGGHAVAGKSDILATRAKHTLTRQGDAARGARAGVAKSTIIMVGNEGNRPKRKCPHTMRYDTMVGSTNGALEKWNKPCAKHHGMTAE